MRSSAGADRCLRGVVFAAGLVLVLCGAATWLFSTLLTAPLMLAGLWVWSWEFAWARRLQHRFRLHLRRLWERARRRPVWWSLASSAGIAVGGAAYWAFVAYGPV